MKFDDYYQILRLAQLLEEVGPIIGRYLEEEVPCLLAEERSYDRTRQMSLPLGIPDEFNSPPRRQYTGETL